MRELGFDCWREDSNRLSIRLWSDKPGPYIHGRQPTRLSFLAGLSRPATPGRVFARVSVLRWSWLFVRADAGRSLPSHVKRAASYG